MLYEVTRSQEQLLKIMEYQSLLFKNIFSQYKSRNIKFCNFAHNIASND